MPILDMHSARAYIASGSAVAGGATLSELAPAKTVLILGLGLSDWTMIVGILCALITCFGNLYYKHRDAKLKEKAEQDAKDSGRLVVVLNDDKEKDDG